MTSEVEELHNIAISIMQNPSINVIIDNSLDTAMTDFKNIFVTIQLIPPELRQYRRVVSRILDGQVSHEAGHIVVTTPVKKKLMEWEERQGNDDLANLVHQTIEDKRVNHFILQRYRFDFAHRLQLLADVTNRLWMDTLKMKIAKERNDNAEFALKPESYFLERKIIAIASLAGMWTNVDVEKEFELNESQKQFVRQTKQIFEEAQFDRMMMSVVRRHQQLYDLWNERVQRTGEKPEENCPKSIGGKLKLGAGNNIKKMMAKMEKKMRDDEKKAEEERKKENKKENEIKEGMAAGAGSGLNIPTPVPDEAQYIIIAQRNREHVERLLNLLKKLAKPKLLVDKWHKQGRMMTEVLSKAFVSSMRREVDNIYARKVIKMEKTEACIGLVVDVSGSVRLSDAQDALCTISEVCGRWLRDEDFAIMDFGSEYQKIKAFVEPYHTTRVRIGGMKCLGGTVLLNPLDEMYKMLKAQRNGRSKILIIVSDFDVRDSDKCKALIRQIEKDGIFVMGLGIDYCNDDKVRNFCGHGKFIGTIRDLPEAVFDLYRGVTM